ncbi:MAG: hypothetical protein JRI25_11405 [Deltaproteobacteria bacterium]|nr:hypothetical protein [Deltaproteobacteria bacterium]
MFAPFVAYLDHPDATLVSLEDPATAGGRGTRFAVIADLDCRECYSLETTRRGYTVHGGTPLGVQYGLAHALELAGFRFYHPYRTRVPERLEVVEEHPDLGVLHEPEMTRRGLHLHTLHPIEGFFDVWVPSDDNRGRASRIIDWTIKSRGNHLQWFGLDDIISSPATHEAWAAHTAAIVDEGHRRGLAMAIAVELFAEANLQRAFDLVDDPNGDLAAQMHERFALLTEDVEWDMVFLTFGEFFDQDPDEFISAIDLANEVLQEKAPGTPMTSWIHVGDDLHVTYNDEEMIFYFLAQFADPSIVPWVHTVMYFDLFEPAHGAYHHEEFDEHRAFLLEKLEAAEPVGYIPESAYWIAFDISVPTYLPLYIRSRWLDVHEVRERASGDGFEALKEHVLFSSGWEWGYWQTDYATLRMNWSCPDAYADVLEEMWAPYDEPALAEAIVGLTEAQHAAFIEGPLAAWFAGRDAILDLGSVLGIVSQPPRPSFNEITTMSPTERQALRDGEVAALTALADATRDALATLEAAEVNKEDPWVAELKDGVEIDALRAEYMAALLGAVLDAADGGSASLDQAEARFSEARSVIDRRHAALHDPLPGRLLEEGHNPTIYQFGYLLRAEELCYWERELIQVRNVVEGGNAVPPGCGI